MGRIPTGGNWRFNRKKQECLDAKILFFTTILVFILLWCYFLTYTKNIALKRKKSPHKANKRCNGGTWTSIKRKNLDTFIVSRLVIFNGGPSRTWTGDTRIFSPPLYQLSYRALKKMAIQKGLEPSISSVTGRHVNHYTTGPVWQNI